MEALHSFALDTLAKRATMDRLSDHEILYSVLGGLQPGGTCLAWIAGLIACESLRLTQRFDEETSWDKRFFVYFSLLMSVTLAGRSSLDRERRLKLWLLFFLRYPETFYAHAKINQCRLFAAMLYHYCIGSYGNYHNLLHVTNVATCGGEEFLCNTLYFPLMVTDDCSNVSGYSFYAHSVWVSGLGKVKICKVPVVKVCTAVLVVGLSVVIVLGIPRAFTIPTFQTVADHGSSGIWGRVVQLICGALLTLLKACDLARSKAVRQMLVSNQDLSVSLLRIGDLSYRLRYVSSILCLLCQTAIFPTIFDLVSLYLRNAKGAGIGYTMMSLSAELHLFGPIMAISATLQEDFLADQASTCSIGNTECKAVVPPTTKKLTFQTQEKRIMKGN
ncbi:hypothetical protein PSTT_09590 [Puccinia striiformis]|uniref:Uncharacterized protein n=1 Tax=Puccinia striiformis TaxID=27350 RepID=A0A2S4V7Y1_9BASI|nr:hypothetical protein PSTT_09590 [Puccinia striiformis]